MYVAFQAGRAQTDPSINWAKGEIGFYDFYIIPLAKKLKDCGVFGVSSDEYLNYALANRREWESRGDEIVGEMVERLQGGTTEPPPPALVDTTEETTTKSNSGDDDNDEGADAIALEDIQFRLTRQESRQLRA